jgi:hypothetical protein
MRAGWTRSSPRDDLDRADVAGGPHVVPPHSSIDGPGLEHAHDVAVLVAEEGDAPELLGLPTCSSRTPGTPLLASVAELAIARSPRSAPA